MILASILLAYVLVGYIVTRWVYAPYEDLDDPFELILCHLFWPVALVIFFVCWLADHWPDYNVDGLGEAIINFYRGRK